MSRLARFAAIQGHSMLTVSAARRRLPSPVGLPLAGFLRRAQRGLPCEVQHDPLEINAAAFRDGDKAALLIAIDTLIAGPDLTAAADALAQECFGPGTVALVAASHTHFAPATERQCASAATMAGSGGEIPDPCGRYRQGRSEILSPDGSLRH